ncbi:MAG: hypothetical protein WC975_05010 [Phycisphaerae bacterium]
MENPRLVKRCLLSLLGIFTALVLACSIYFKDPDILVGWLGWIIVIFVVCVLMQMCLATVFIPVFWLMSKLMGKKGGSPDDFCHSRADGNPVLRKTTGLPLLRE